MPTPVLPATKSTKVHKLNGSCVVDGLHIDKHGKVKIFSPDFDCSVGFNPANLLASFPANPAPIKKGKHITIEVGDKSGIVFLTITGGPCGKAQQVSPDSPNQIVIEGAAAVTVTASGGTGPMTSPNQIVID